MKLVTAVTLAAVLVLAGCGDDDESLAKDAAARADASVLAKNDGGVWWPTPEASMDGSAATPPIQFRTDAAISAPDAGIFGTMDSGSQWDASVVADASPAWILDQVCPASTDTNRCYACEDENCCETYARYAANVEAVAYRGCYQQCAKQPIKGESCEEHCHAAHPTGTKDFAEKIACSLHFCSSICSNEPVDPCLACSQQYCATELIATTATESGFLAQGCNRLCGDNNPICAQSCWDKYDISQELTLAAGDCVLTFCPGCEAVPQ
jgi:hypothetical protein